MKTNKEYPATHSMSTAWFAIDANGEVAIFDFDENGLVPDGLEESCIMDLVYRSFSPEDYFHIDFTEEQCGQLLSVMSLIEEYPYDWYESIGTLIAEVDRSKFSILETARLFDEEENELICLNENKNIYLIDFHCPWHEKRSVREAMEKQASMVYEPVIAERAIVRFVDVRDFDTECVYDDVSKVDEKSDKFDVLPFYLFQQPYSTDYLIKRTAIPQKTLNATQLSQRFIDKALKLPIKFSETEQLQIAEYVQSTTTYCLADEVLVYKGCRYKLLPRSNGELAYILFDHDDNLNETVPLVFLQNDLPEDSEIKLVEDL